jgi:hypothetical protein
MEVATVIRSETGTFIRSRSSHVPGVVPCSPNVGYDSDVRVVWMTLLLGCSASGGSSETSGDASVKSDAVVDSADDDAAGDAIFPTEDGTVPGDDTSAPTTDADTDSGTVDACDCMDVAVNVADCGTASCPPDYPFPVGCNITMGGSDSRGCVVHASGSSNVSFQVGSSCSGTADGFVTGTITCSKTAGPPLSAINCKISKPIKRYVTSLSACP